MSRLRKESLEASHPNRPHARGFQRVGKDQRALAFVGLEDDVTQTTGEFIALLTAHPELQMDVTSLPTKRLLPLENNERGVLPKVNGLPFDEVQTAHLDNRHGRRLLRPESSEESQKIDLVFQYIAIHAKVAYFLGLITGALYDYKNGNSEFQENAEEILYGDTWKEFYRNAMQPGYSRAGMSANEFLEQIYHSPGRVLEDISREALGIAIQGNNPELTTEERRLVEDVIVTSEAIMSKVMVNKLEGKTGIFLRETYRDNQGEAYTDFHQIASLLYWLKVYHEEKLPEAVRQEQVVFTDTEADLTMRSRYWCMIPLRDLPFIFDWFHNLGILGDMQARWKEKGENPLVENI